MAINSLRIDLSNLGLEKETIKEYILDNSEKAIEPNFLPDIIYSYSSDELVTYLKSKNVQISEQRSFVQM